MSGFVSSGFSVGGGKGATGAFQMAIVGGTVSAIGGGKFANGAMGSAFQYLFNDWLSDMRQKVNENVMRNDQEMQTFRENSAKFTGEVRSGFISGLRNTSSLSAVASIATASAGQFYLSGAFVATGYASDWILLNMGEMAPQTMFNNVYLDSAMYPLTSKFPMAGGVTNLATKTLVNQ